MLVPNKHDGSLFLLDCTFEEPRSSSDQIDIFMVLKDLELRLGDTVHDGSCTVSGIVAVRWDIAIPFIGLNHDSVLCQFLEYGLLLV